jgi:putative methionine-R-sulfoxide reductase with GAF domain
MANDAGELLKRVRQVLSKDASRHARAGRLAEAIRMFGGFRWVGVYDVDATTVSILAWSGADAPAYPTFPVTKGLTGAAILKSRRSTSQM